MDGKMQGLLWSNKKAVLKGRHHSSKASWCKNHKLFEGLLVKAGIWSRWLWESTAQESVFPSYT